MLGNGLVYLNQIQVKKLCTPGHTQFLGRHKSLIKLFKAPGGLDRNIAWKKITSN